MFISTQLSCLKLLRVSYDCREVFVNSIYFFFAWFSIQMINASLITWLRRCFLPHPRSRACQILSHLGSQLLDSSSQMSPEYPSVYCASSSFVLPQDSLQKLVSFLCHLFPIPNSQFSVFLIISGKSDSQSTRFCFSETENPMVTKQVYRSKFHSILVYFEVGERPSHLELVQQNHRH